LRKGPRSAFPFVLTLLAVASMWFYVERILIPQQVRDATAHNRPRGNLSDLYPRWLGARELLLHRRNPYSHDVTVEIQQGFYGRPLDAWRPDDPRDQEAFTYPAYVVFLLAPFVGFPFPAVQIVFGWILVALSAASVPLWLMALRWKLPPMPMAICLALTLGSFPVAQGIKLQQLSLLVAVFLALSAACAASGYLFCSGALLALTTIKPQLAGPIVVWLLLWASSEWRARRRLVLGFVSVMALLLAGAQFLLPGWWRMFAEALRQYHQYTQNQSVLDLLADGTLGPRVGLALGVVAGLACGIVAWRTRRQKADTPEFAHALALVLALTVVIVPVAAYNQVLLLPAILWLARQWAVRSRVPAIELLLYAVAVVVLAWSWIGSLTLSAAYFLLSPTRAQSAWSLPLYSTLALPVLVLALLFWERGTTRLAGPRIARSSGGVSD
jgi:hypothetical protein